MSADTIFRLLAGLFIHGIGNVSAKYELEITPAPWAFGIWGLIYLFQAGWLLYAVSNIFRSFNGYPAYMSPTILTPTFFVAFIINNISNIIWLFMWDREYIVPAVPMLGLTAMTCYMGLMISYSRLDRVREDLVDNGRQAEITVIRIFVFNGLGEFALRSQSSASSSSVTFWGPFVHDLTACACALSYVLSNVLLFKVSELQYMDPCHCLQSHSGDCMFMYSVVITVTCYHTMISLHNASKCSLVLTTCTCVLSYVLSNVLPLKVRALRCMDLCHHLQSQSSDRSFI